MPLLPVGHEPLERVHSPHPFGDEAVAVPALRTITPVAATGAVRMRGNRVTELAETAKPPMARSADAPLVETSD